MKNKILVLLFVAVLIGSFNTQKLSAQVSSGMQDNWVHLESYNGYEKKNHFSFWIQLDGNNINYPEWSLAVRLGEPMTNAEGKTIPPSKVSVRFNKFESNGVRKTISGMGADQTAIPLSLENKYIIRNSGEPIFHGESNYYSKYIFYIDILIEGGSYLEDLLSNPPIYNNDFKYPFHLIFSVLDADGNIITQSNTISEIKINPTDTPPSGPEFGFEVNANATLDFNTPEQYTRQVENNPINSWVNVTSKKSGYVIKVKANNPNFELIRNDSGVSGDATIPVNVVNVEMQSAGSGTSQGPKKLSSENAQTLFIGNKNNNPQKLPVRYFITKTEAEKLATKTSGEYKAILTYTLEPN